MPPTFLTRWHVFVRERFPLMSHLIMVAAFVTGNAAASAVFIENPLHPFMLVCIFLVTLLMFFRLRVFDEIKDYKTDQDVHPDRPLARGLITPGEAKRVAAGVVLLELVLVSACGWAAFTAWAALLVFSLLMYREFFLGPWLRPKMELYAVLHTLVAGWIGLFIAAALAQRPLWQLPAGLWFFALANWVVFNVFEFARKTYAREEETSIASYSNRLRPWGAALLAMSMVAGAAAGAYLLMKSTGLPIAAVACGVGLVIVPAAGAIIYVIHPHGLQAKAYRGVMQLFIIGYYVILGSCILSRRLHP